MHTRCFIQYLILVIAYFASVETKNSWERELIQILRYRVRDSGRMGVKLGNSRVPHPLHEILIIHRLMSTCWSTYCDWMCYVLDLTSS